MPNDKKTKKPLRPIKKAEHINNIAGFANISLIFGFLLRPDWKDTLLTAAHGILKFSLFSFGMIVDVIRTALALYDAWQARKKNGYGKRIFNALVELLCTLTVAIGTSVAIFLNLTFAPILFTAVTAVKAAVQFGMGFLALTRYPAEGVFAHFYTGLVLSFITVGLSLALIALKPLGAIVGIIGAVAGGAFSIYQLATRQEADPCLTEVAAEVEEPVARDLRFTSPSVRSGVDSRDISSQPEHLRALLEVPSESRLQQPTPVPRQVVLHATSSLPADANQAGSHQLADLPSRHDSSSPTTPSSCEELTFQTPHHSPDATAAAVNIFSRTMTTAAINTSTGRSLTPPPSQRMQFSPSSLLPAFNPPTPVRRRTPILLPLSPPPAARPTAKEPTSGVTITAAENRPAVAQGR